jgi:hypothetical protein
MDVTACGFRLSCDPRNERRREDRLELYASFLKLAPLLLLKLPAKGRFGPWKKDGADQGGLALAGDVMLVVAVVLGAFIAVLVLGGALPSTASTRGVLVAAGCLSMLALGEHQVRHIASLYRARPQAVSLEDNASGASADPGESS